MIAQGHRIIANGFHAFEIRLGILNIRFRYAGVDVATAQYQQLAALLFDLFANLIDQCFLCGQTVFTVLVLPKTTVVIVGVQNGQTHTRVVLCGFGLGRYGKGAAQHGENGNGQWGVFHERLLLFVLKIKMVI